MISIAHPILYGNKIENNVMDGACSTYGLRYWFVQDSGGNREWKRRPGKHRSRWKDYISTNLQEVECSGRDWIELAQDRGSWQ